MRLNHCNSIINKLIDLFLKKKRLLGCVKRMSKILVVDNDPIIRKMINEVLEAENFEVKAVGTEEDRV